RGREEALTVSRDTGRRSVYPTRYDELRLETALAEARGRWAVDRVERWRDHVRLVPRPPGEVPVRLLHRGARQAAEPVPHPHRARGRRQRPAARGHATSPAL